MKCVSYTRTIPWKNHKGELTIADQNQRIAEYLAEMIDDGVEQKFDCIIVASMYYCGPDFPAARQAIKETLYETGVNLIVLEEGLDTRTASRKEVEDYFEEKRCEMHAEIMFAWRKKQGAGFRLTNSVPFGYIRRNGESNMVKDEEVASYLSEAFSRYASGQKISAFLFFSQYSILYAEYQIIFPFWKLLFYQTQYFLIMEIVRYEA